MNPYSNPFKTKPTEMNDSAKEGKESLIEPETTKELTEEEMLEIVKRFHEQPLQFVSSNMRNKQNVLAWAKEKGILEKATPMSQAIKTLEEVQELLKAIDCCDEHEIKDAYGDILVTIIIGAELSGMDIEDCLQGAYDVIKGRTGRMENGTFIKDK